jgi:hypothetical protein
MYVIDDKNDPKVDNIFDIIQPLYYESEAENYEIHNEYFTPISCKEVYYDHADDPAFWSEMSNNFGDFMCAPSLSTF